MGKKLIYLLILLFIGGFIVMQSCNESPIVSTNENYDPYAISNGFVKPDGELRTFCGSNPPSVRPILVGTNNCTPPSPGTGTILELWPGVHIYGGYVEFTGYNSTTRQLDVTMHFVSPEAFPWHIGWLHFQAQDNSTGFPLSPGSFTTYSENFNSTNSSESFSCTLPESSDGEYWMALHLEMDLYGGTEGFEFYLPNELIEYTVNYNSPTSYFKSTFTDAGFLTGMTLESYCIDPDIYMNPAGGLELQGYIYSSYETLPGYINTELENTYNLDLVNWIINRYYAGDMTIIPKTYNVDWHSAHNPFPEAGFSDAAYVSPVTWEDIQAAIWALMDNDVVYNHWRFLPNLTNRNTDQRNAWGIIFAALYEAHQVPNVGTVYGYDGFTPGCEQKIAAILVPSDPQNPAQLITIQPIISYLQLPCITYDETAYLDGYCGQLVPRGAGNMTWFKWKISCQ